MVSEKGVCCFVMKWHHFHKFFKLSLLIWTFILALNGYVLGSDLDKPALLEFKAAILDPSGLLSTWGSADHCSWHGVACDASSRVVALNITGRGGEGNLSCAKTAHFPLYGFGIRRPCSNSNAKIVGKLPLAIAKLGKLKVLSLPFNELSGEIPVDIWNMENLEVLDLEGNAIGGVLPSLFKGLRNLRVLNLGFNKIEGEIPDSLSNCSGLQVINLAGNGVNGSVPGFIGGFKDLRGLYLSFNQLSGPIPQEIGDNCLKLERLELAANYLTEGIPVSLGKCRALQSILLYSNLLQDAIPAELGDLNQLEVLDLSRNSLTGAIPSELGNCLKLSVLVLSNLWEPLPSASDLGGDSMKLAYTNDDYNFYHGTIPDGITSLGSLRMLWAPRATLEGKLPSAWGSCNDLEVVNLGQNDYTGEIPLEFSNCENLKFLNVSSNNLSGKLDDKLPVPCMTVFDVSGNFLSGSIPKFYYNVCAPVLSTKRVALEPYDASSAYVSFFAYRTQVLTHLPSFGDGNGPAVFHNFGGNNFTGSLQLMPIDPRMSQEQIVYAFLAGRNRFSGPFPGILFEKCSELRGMIVDISNNRLSGQIPADAEMTCPSLTYLDVSSNQIAGFIPPAINSWISLVDLNFGRNQLQGSIPGSLGQLKTIKSLSLARNTLTGSIPSSLGNLHSLEVLDLSSNTLSGEIPMYLPNLRNLTVLLLNNNNLTGQIPSGLANVTILAAFNASFNNLSGPLPPNGKLITCSSVIGNPLIQSCHMSSTPPSDRQGTPSDVASPSGSTQKERKNGINSIEIASITAAAAIVSVLIALVILFFYTRKRLPKSRISVSVRKEVTIFTDIGVPLIYENVVQSFNVNNCIGHGGFGATYKAEVAPGVLVAIKRLAEGRLQGGQQFDAEIRTLGRVHHPNLVTLIGYHASERETFLVYNYLPGGNLEKFIQERSTRAVDWRILHKIALDIARALSYLHDHCVPRVLHRDVKPSNILLDEDHNAYLSDFGLARLLGASETHATTGVAGTFGYVAPEYAMTSRVSDKADVYSYGVVLLELISNKKVLDPSFSSYGNGFNIVAWASMLLRQGDAKEFFTSGLWDAGPHDDLIEVLQLAVECTVDSRPLRPTMKHVFRRLKQLQPPSL